MLFVFFGLGFIFLSFIIIISIVITITVVTASIVINIIVMVIGKVYDSVAQYLISIIVSGWINNGNVMQGLENICNKKLRYEHHHKNFEESILQNITPYGLRIYKKSEISGISPDFMGQWNSVSKSTERHLVELLLKESKKVISSLNNEFETLLKSSFSKYFKVERDRIVKSGKKNARSLQDKRIKKWRKFDSNSFKYDSERRIMLIIVSNLLILRIESSVNKKIQTNGSQP